MEEMGERRKAAGLRPEQDAYGQLLVAELEGRGGQEIMEREDGFVYCGDPADYFAPYRRWPAAEKKAMRFVRGRVLDVGCGAGRDALHLQERGHEVVAIDVSPLAVDVAQRRGVRRAEVLALGEVDDSLGLFDTVILLRNNFGLAGPERAAPQMLRRLARRTTEPGRLVTDSVDPARLDPDMRTRLRFRVRYRAFASPWFRYLMLAPAEFEELVAGTGWLVRRVIRDATPRFVVVLEKGRRGGA